jgi:hypothetical protein
MGSPYILYDGARVSRESALGKELEKHERKPDWTPEKNPFPRMLYKATHRPDGKRSVHEVLDHVVVPSGQQVYAGAAEQWSSRCQLTVRDERELSRALETGWRKTPQEAMELLESQDNAKGNETAERHYKDQSMSEPARREAEAADMAAGLKQVPSIPEQPIRRRGRQPGSKNKPKIQPAG